MVSVRAGAAAKQHDWRRLPIHQLPTPHLASHKKERRTFADIDAVTVGRERIAARIGHRLQRREAIQGQAAETVHPTTEHRIAHPHTQQTLGTEQGAGAGGAGGGDHIAGAAQLQPLAEKRRRRHQLLLAVAVVGRQLSRALLLGDA